MLDAPAIYALREDKASRLYERGDVAILHAGAELDDADDITRSLERQNLLVPGAVLVASPYRDGVYAPLDEAAQAFAREKWAAVSALCSRLGARSLKVKVIEDSLSSSRIEMKGSASGRLASGDASLAMKQMERLAAELTWEDEFSDGVTDIEEAKRYMSAAGLESDPETRFLLDARAYEGNRLRKRTVSFDLSRESERTLEAALELKVPLILGMEGTFSRASESRAHYRVKTEIEFND